MAISPFFLRWFLLAVFYVFYFPEILTTPEYRHNYPVEILRGVLLMCMLFSFLFALVSLILCKSKIPSLLATVISGLSILMGGATVEIKQFNDLGFYVSLDWLLLDLLVLALIFIPVELFFPKRTNQSKFHEEWKTDLIYFAFGHLLIQMTAVSVQAPASYYFGSLHLEGLHNFVQALPFLIELPLALLVTDLFQYSAHRAFHRMPLLWRFHAVHHSIRAVDWMAGSRLHIIDVLVTRAFSYLPLYVLGFFNRSVLHVRHYRLIAGCPCTREYADSIWLPKIFNRYSAISPLASFRQSFRVRQKLCHSFPLHRLFVWDLPFAG